VATITRSLASHYLKIQLRALSLITDTPSSVPRTRHFDYTVRKEDRARKGEKYSFSLLKIFCGVKTVKDRVKK
jgi:hypothetical protein